MPPLIEILPHTSTTSTAPGWAYVLDTGPLLDPSKASVLQPAGPRHRTARAAGGEAARQSAAVVKRLAELEKDGHRELQVQVPVGSGRGREVGRSELDLPI
jgi:zinc finger HIT domain-containing protein 1